MNDDQQRDNLFSVLKQILKTRGYTYAKLAAAMHCSELTVKRLFKDRDCKMSRLQEICAIVGMSLADLVDMQERISSSAQYLPRATEQALADDPKIFVFLLLLVSWLDTERIAIECKLSDAQIYQQLRTLEKLGVIELQTDNKVKYLVSLPIRWRLDGPLNGLIKQANMRYICHCIDQAANPDYSFSSASRLMSIESATQIQESLGQVKRDFDYLATQDQMFHPSEQLVHTKLVYAMGPFPILDIFRPED